MSCRGLVGNILVKGQQDIEWKMHNFLLCTLFTAGEYVTSPRFTMYDCEWYFKMCPNGNNGKDCVGWISLYICMSKCSSEKGATINFGIKNLDGEVEKVVPSTSQILTSLQTDWGYDQFLMRSTLEARETELAPSDVLTITCTLWAYNSFDFTSGPNYLSNNLLDMFTSEEAYDVTLRVENEQFLAHKCILMARSPVFKRMFVVPMKEKTTGEVHINDCNPSAFRDFLVYLYAGRLEKPPNHLFELYEIADKYQVLDLKSHCLIAIMGNLTNENICDALILCDKYDESSLKRNAEEFFNENYAEIFCTDRWEAFLEEKPRLANQMLKKMAWYLKSK